MPATAKSTPEAIILLRPVKRDSKDGQDCGCGCGCGCEGACSCGCGCSR